MTHDATDDDIAAVHRANRDARIVERAREAEARRDATKALAVQMQVATTVRIHRRRNRVVVALWIVAAAVTCACAGAFAVWSLA